MGWKYTCNDCGAGSDYIDYLGKDIWKCNRCGGHSIREEYIPHPFERRRAAVYATGNRWAIENWNATH